MNAEVVLGLVGINKVAGEATQCNTIIKECVKRSKPELLAAGSDGEISQWLTYSAGPLESVDASLSFLEDWLTLRSYMVGVRFSIADVAVLASVSSFVKTADAKKYCNVIRWYDHIQSLCANIGDAYVQFEDVDSTPMPVFTAPSSSSSSVSKETEKGLAKGKDKASEKGENKAKDAAVKTPVSTSDDVDPSKIVFVVGKVLKCWNHEGSDKLLCEEVDCGEEKPRQIASGIRAFYQASDLEGRLVLVAANLKARKIADFPSEGMVLCAVGPDHSAVKLLEPPAGAEPGQRVVFPGYEGGEPATPAQVAKKKLLEKVLPDLKTNDKGECCWRDSIFTLPSGVVTAPLANMQIS